MGGIVSGGRVGGEVFDCGCWVLVQGIVAHHLRWGC